MKPVPLLCAILLISAIVLPAAADEPGRYSYFRIDSICLSLENEEAIIDVHYSIDEGVRILVLLLGKSDLKNKLEKVLNFENARFRQIELDHAVIVVSGMSYDYGDGSFWFPEHEFGATIPVFTVITPQTERSFTMVRSVPGIGYFEIEG